MVLAFANKTSFDHGVDYLASVWFKQSIDADEIIKRYKRALSNSNRSADPIKILIVPGHDEDSPGAIYKNSSGQIVREADQNLIVGRELFNLLDKEKGIEVFLVRDENGYNPEFSKYLTEKREEIALFYETKRVEMAKLVVNGSVESYQNVHHNSARPEVVQTLYSINKFANDEKFDIVIHLHFNDYPGRRGLSGKYSGFAIYAPEKQFSNSKASKIFAGKLADQLSYLFASSDQPKESAVVEDQELIAVGANNTADPVSVLIEYGYIYESQFNYPVIKDTILKELAHQTYLGIGGFLNEENVRRETAFDFKKYLTDRNFSKSELRQGHKSLDVLAWQYYLRDLGVYPVNGDLNSCPISGNFGDCTAKALAKYGK